MRLTVPRLAVIGFALDRLAFEGLTLVGFALDRFQMAANVGENVLHELVS